MSNFWGAVQKLDFLCLTFGVQYISRGYRQTSNTIEAYSKINFHSS